MLLDPRLMRFYAQLSGAVFTKLLLILIGAWLGSRLDRAWGCSPLGMMIGLVVGAGLGLWFVIHVANQRTRL